MNRSRKSGLAMALVLLGMATPALSHHSYALFDMSQRRTIDGVVAKLEWTNPHTFVWLYVKGKNGYDLYSFESSGVAELRRYGWTPVTLAPGEKLTVEYFPLKDGRNGGAFIRAMHADGHVTNNEPDAPGQSGASAFDKNKKTP